MQKRLYVTKEVADVAAIAQELGFDVSAAEILKAQAGRVLEMPQKDIEETAAGFQAEYGAQWGRGGTGYLNAAGKWLLQFQEWGFSDKGPIETFLREAKEELLSAKTHNDVALIAKRHGYEIDGPSFACYAATQIRKLDDEKAERVARGD